MPMLNIGNLIRGTVGKVAGRPTNEYLKTLNEDDFMSANTTIYSGKWNKIGDFTVPAGNIYEFGYGTPDQPENQGYIYAYVKDATGTEITGKLRLVVADPNERTLVNVFEERSDVLHGSLSDKRQKVPLPRTGVKANEDDKLQIWFKPDSDSTVSYTQSVILVPTTNTQLTRF